MSLFQSSGYPHPDLFQICSWNAVLNTLLEAASANVDLSIEAFGLYLVLGLSSGSPALMSNAKSYADFPTLLFSRWGLVPLSATGWERVSGGISLAIWLRRVQRLSLQLLAYQQEPWGPSGTRFYSDRPCFDFQV